MTYTTALLIVVALEAAVLVALLIRERWRAHADRALRGSEGKYRLIAEHAPVIVWTARPDTMLDYVNGTCREFTGLPMEKLLGEGWLDVVHPDDLERCAAIYVPAFEARRPFLFEYRARRSDGAYRWLLANGVPKYDPDGSFTGYLGCDVDITELKDAEERIRASQVALEVSHREIQHLAGRLIEAQDAERARFARDLHDDVSQQLAGLSIALSGLRRRVEEEHAGEDVHFDLRFLHERTTALAQTVRHLSHDLHPTVLRHGGLVAALTSYCAEVERVHGTASKCSAEGDFTSISPEVSLCFYRIAQEALRNVVAHARASRADVRLACTRDGAELTIADDGTGFEVTSALRRSKGLGLISISERIRLAGGTLSITSAPGAGTRVTVQVPVVAPMGGKMPLRKTGGESTVTPRQMPRNTVLLADDHMIVAEGLARLLRDHDFDVVATVGDGSQLVDAANRLRPDVIVTDISMPGLSGLDVLARLRAERIDSKIVVLTMHNDADLATAAIRGGASGFLLKEAAGEELVAAIRQVLQGHVYLAPALTRDVMERMAGSSRASDAQLTPRQLDVLRLIVKGQRMKEIAASLRLSSRTVETHKYEMMQTLGLHSTAELVRYALDRRLDGPPAREVASP